MITKKNADPSSRPRAAWRTDRLQTHYSPDCEHERFLLVRIDCGSGGVQYRRYCRTCWTGIGGAIPHAEAKAEEKRTGLAAPLADLKVLHAARDAYESSRSGLLL